MHKEIGFMMLILVFCFVGFNPLKTIVVNEPVEAGSQFQTRVDLRNDLHTDMEDVSVKLLIYDLGLVFPSVGFDLEAKDSVGVLINGELPADVPPGDYLVRVTASNDLFRDVKHVYLTVK